MDAEKIKKIRNAFCTFMLFLLIGLMVISIRVLQYEKEQNHKIEVMLQQVDFLRKQLDLDETLWDDGAYNFLAIGNSVTLHGMNDYWFQECGMAASDLKNDYVHVLAELFEQEHSSVVFQAYNFSTWEVNAHDRSEYLPLLEDYFVGGDKLNLVIIQLSENAKIIVLGDIWYDEKDEIKERVAEACEVSFISFDGIRTLEYQCGIGTVVYDDEGNSYIVDHEGVARHPGDFGMKWIADRIYEEVND